MLYACDLCLFLESSFFAVLHRRLKARACFTSGALYVFCCSIFVSQVFINLTRSYRIGERMMKSMYFDKLTPRKADFNNGGPRTQQPRAPRLILGQVRAGGMRVRTH